MTRRSNSSRKVPRGRLKALQLSFLVGVFSRSRCGAWQRPGTQVCAPHPDVERHAGGCNQHRRERDEKDNQKPAHEQQTTVRIPDGRGMWLGVADWTAGKAVARRLSRRLNPNRPLPHPYCLNRFREGTEVLPRFLEPGIRRRGLSQRPSAVPSL